MRDLYGRFIDKVKLETIEGSLVWEKVDPIIQRYGSSSFDQVLFTNEFHRINMETSFCSISQRINVFLIDEEFESGEDGSINRGVNLYVSNSTEGPSYRVPLEQQYSLELQLLLIEIVNGNDELDTIITSYLEN